MSNSNKISIQHAEPAFELPGLSPREIQILRQLALGRTDKRIENSLNLSVKTVNHHVNHILIKLGATKRTHAVAKALMTGLIRLRPSDAAIHLGERRLAPSALTSQTAQEGTGTRPALELHGNGGEGELDALRHATGGNCAA